MKRQLDCSRALCMACADLGNACSEADVRDAQFQNTQFQLDEDLRKRLDEAIVHVLESIDQKIAPFVELEKMVVNRNNLKLDYDHYVRKVKDLKDRPQSDPAKVSNNEAKLTAARQRLNEATSKLYKGFGYYDAVGGRLVQPEIEMFKKAQQDFFAAASATVKGMTTRDPKDVAMEVEAAGKDGMSAPVTLPSSEYDAQAAAGGIRPTGVGGGAPSDASFSKDSPDRSPVSAYVPSASAPWITNPGGTSGTGASSFAPGGSSYQSPGGAGQGGGGGGGGSSWWDKHASAADKQVTTAWEGPETRAPSVTQTRARALFSYTAADNTELSFAEGEVLTVITQDESGWWTGEKGARKGLFPSNYVELI
ncbi:unnamed protein product [Ascophyllum nodosum]